MKIILHRWLLLVSLSTTLAVDSPQLPPCPTSLQYFPQSLPMHCRMPRSADPGQFPDMSQFPTLPPLPESFYQSPSPDKQPPPVPIPIPPFPGMPPGAMPMPGPMGGPMGGPMPGMPGPMPMPIPMVGGPPHKLPVIVMPFYSPDNSFKKPQQDPHNHRGHKKRPPRKKKKKPSHDSDSDTSSGETTSGSSDSNDSSEHGFWKGRRRTRRKMSRRSNKRHRMRRKETSDKNKDLLTPILQYVTKDGYVIFEKQISKSEAKDWLKPKSVANVVEDKHEEKHDEFRQKSAEDFFKLDAEDIRMKAEERSKEAAEIEATTKKKRRHNPKKVNSLMKFKPNLQS